MKHYDITRPIGLSTPCEEIEATCRKAHMYKRCGLRPKHYIVPLDSGSGRTTLVEYMTKKYKEAGVIDFGSGLDDYIEISFDGTLPQLKQAFANIDSAAVYANEYRNIVGMDISSISAHLAETQFTEFMKNCKRVCEYACIIFFVHGVPNRNEEKLIEKICDIIDNVKRLTVEPYTNDDICALIVKKIVEHGIEIKHESVFCTMLSEVVSTFCINNVKDAISTADELVHYADFSGFTPVVDEKSLKSMITGWHKDAERSEVK